MDMPENEDNNELTVDDFAFICRICCERKSGLRVFQDERYLYDLFNIIRQIDVQSTNKFPRNICNGCLENLGVILSIMENLKYKDTSFEDIMQLKKEPVKCASKLKDYIEINEENENDKYHQRSQICHICSSLANILTLSEDTTKLIQLFQIMINVKAGFITPSINGICNKCNNDLENVLSYITLSSDNDQKFELIIQIKNMNESVIRNNENMRENVLEEVTDRILAISSEINSPNILSSHSRPFPDEATFEDVPSSGQQSHLSINLRKFDKGKDLLKQSISKQLHCDYCKESFTKKLASQQHLLTHTEETTINCGNNSGNKGKFQIQMLDHSEEWRCECCRSENCFYQKSSSNSHMLTHTKEKPFKCDSCEKLFTKNSYLKKHMLTHTNKKPFKCDSCEKCYKKKANLKRHMLSHTKVTKVTSFKCDNCEKCFNQESNLQHHMLTHTKKRPFKCDGCDKCFTRKSSLIRHMLTHTKKKQFKCDRCEKWFNKNSNLQSHMLTHTKEYSFKCDRCEKCFNQMRSLNKHILTHTKEYSFKCNSCEKYFTRKSNLNRHMLTHTKEKPLN